MQNLPFHSASINLQSTLCPHIRTGSGRSILLRPELRIEQLFVDLLQRPVVDDRTAESYDEDFRMGGTTPTQQQQHFSDSPSFVQANSQPSGQVSVISSFMTKPPVFCGREMSIVEISPQPIITLPSERKRAGRQIHIQHSQVQPVLSVAFSCQLSVP